MKLISWNVNGIRAAARKGFLDYLRDEDADVVCVQETKAREAQLEPELRQPPGYSVAWNSADKPGYSGVATFCKREPAAVAFGIGEPRFDAEGRIIATDHRDFILFNVYFPNGQRDHGRLQYKLQFYEAFLKHCMKLRQQDKSIIITGDFNTAHREIDLKNPKANEQTSGFLPEERIWIDRYLDHGFVDTFRALCDEPGHYTWWTYRYNARARNIGWRIDYFMVSEDLAPRVQRSYMRPEIPGSDHCPIVLELE